MQLFKMLRLPVLSFSRHPHDRHTVPLPDLHMVVGLFSEPLGIAQLFPELEAFISGRSTCHVHVPP